MRSMRKQGNEKSPERETRALMSGSQDRRYVLCSLMQT